MARYFFHLRDGEDVLLDPEGTELAGLAAIAAAAMREARSIISHDALDGRIDLAQAIEVQDSWNKVVYRLRFADAVEITEFWRNVSPAQRSGGG